MASNTEFRICPETGLRVHLPAERLIKANAVVAVVFLAIGGLFGLAVALTRWPAVHLLPADWFYLALTAHGLDVLIVERSFQTHYRSPSKQIKGGRHLCLPPLCPLVPER